MEEMGKDVIEILRFLSVRREAIDCLQSSDSVN